ncbi:hypothetical protein H2199_001057 [Coniosporium tulheliwenetii]|uniref:Uncharacterized protein n=1 Tax=Coniosporium tulheliwenetii TaxID=3383036 RepID=A0ACC2ZKS4_9PEZI|nr:hypothetical protein H2199_001057 [Cladosporium sp. JES 115]
MPLRESLEVKVKNEDEATTSTDPVTKERAPARPQTPDLDEYGQDLDPPWDELDAATRKSLTKCLELAKMSRGRIRLTEAYEINGVKTPATATAEDLLMAQFWSEGFNPAAASELATKRKRATDTAASTNEARRGRLPKPKSSAVQVIQFLLSPAALDLCRPEEETKGIQAHGDEFRTYYSSKLNPFEELMCAVMFGRWGSHVYKLRTIRTILEKPYEFTSARAVRDAGIEKCQQAVSDAPGMQEGKTVKLIGVLADIVSDKFAKGDDPDGITLEAVREEAGYDTEKERNLIGCRLGKGAPSNFFRRIQWLWKENYEDSFMDERTKEAVQCLGLPDDCWELQTFMDRVWSELDTKGIDGEDEDMRKRLAYVIVLDRAVGADLEHKLDAILKSASKI